MKPHIIYKSAQKGSVLIVSMLILLVLTLIGVTAMGTSALEEKMAGNSRDQNQAFQAAETTLRDAETELNKMVATGNFNNTNGLYTFGNAPDIMLASTWSGTNSIVYSGTLPNTTTQPRYIIELQPVLAGNNLGEDLSSNSYGASAPPSLNIFRITARATGGSDNAVVMLQTYFGKPL